MPFVDTLHIYYRKRHNLNQFEEGSFRKLLDNIFKKSDHITFYGFNAGEQEIELLVWLDNRTPVALLTITKNNHKFYTRSMDLLTGIAESHYNVVSPEEWITEYYIEPPKKQDLTADEIVDR